MTSGINHLRWPTCIGYARVSDRERAINGWSLAGQVEAIGRLAQSQHLQLLSVFEDGGRSGGSMHRRFGLAAVLEAVASGGIGALVVWRGDRLARQVHEGHQIRQACLNSGTAIVILEPFDVQLPGGASDMQRELGEIFAQDEREKIITRVTPAITRAAVRGIRGGYVPLGYRRSVDGSYHAHDPWASRIPEIFAMAAAGTPTGQIARNLLERGWKRSDGTSVTWDQLHHTLSNRFYLGEFRWQVPARMRTDHGSEVLIERNHVPLIDSELYARVQLALAKRKRPQVRKKAHEAISLSLSRPLEVSPVVLAASIRQRQHAIHGLLGPEILRCACGNKMYATLMTCGSRGERYRLPIYQCHRRKMLGEAGCRHLHVRVSDIDGEVVQRLKACIARQNIEKNPIVAVHPSPSTKLHELKEKRERLARATMIPGAVERLALIDDEIHKIVQAAAGNPVVLPEQCWWGLGKDFDHTWKNVSRDLQRRIVTHAFCRAVISGKQLTVLEPRQTHDGENSHEG